MTGQGSIAAGRAIAARRASARAAARAAGTGPTKAAEDRGRSSRRRGDDNEKRTLEQLVRPYYPKARRTRPGEAGPDAYTEGVGDRVMEFTVAEWVKLGTKMDQAAAAAAAAGVAEYVVIKARRQDQPGDPRRWWAIQDGAVYMDHCHELDQLRAEVAQLRKLIGDGGDRYMEGYGEGYEAAAQ